VSWSDAVAYTEWLSAQTGKAYRLLTEAEREYIARAGSGTPYWWGATVNYKLANYDTRRDAVRPGPELPPGCPREGTSPVGCFAPNPWGFFEVHGNVAEWTQDCWNRDYKGAPIDGSAALAGDCSRRVLRGGGWNYWPEDIRAAYREAAPAEHRYFHVGFRVARDVER
jgi:formylglycine-generating enzyme required for sulfatase activity